MIRNALASLLVAKNMAHEIPKDRRYSQVAEAILASSPTTHDDGSVTWNPPKKYDRPFDGTEAIRRLPQPEVVEACRKLFADADLNIAVSPTQKGCAVYKGRNGTIIVIDKPFMGVTPEAAIRHERGHLNGWKQDHPD
jgi:hypothetical protein